MLWAWAAVVLADVSNVPGPVRIPKSIQASQGTIVGTSDAAAGLSIAKRSRVPVMMVFWAPW